MSRTIVADLMRELSGGFIAAAVAVYLDMSWRFCVGIAVGFFVVGVALRVGRAP